MLLHSIANPRVDPQPFTSHGQSVAMDGNLVAVGAPHSKVQQVDDRGAVKIYEGVTGEIQYVITNPRAESGHDFGASVAVGGSWVVVGAPRDDTGATAAGSVYIYNLNSQTPTEPVWTLRNPSPNNDDHFGSSVAIDNMRVVVGADQDDTGGTDSGVAYIYFLFDETSPLPVETLVNPSPFAGDRFGCSVAVNGDTVVVGAYRDDSGAGDAGSAYVYDMNADDPSVPVLTLNNPSPGTADWFGNAVAVSGAKIVVGAYGNDAATMNGGSAYVYDLASASPAVPILTLDNPSQSSNAYFGFSVALYGARVAIGAPRDNTQANLAGSAYLYDLASPTPAVPIATLADPAPLADARFGTSVAMSGSTTVVGAPGSRSAYGYFIGSVSQLRTYSPGPAPGDLHGSSVALSGTWLAAGAPSDRYAPTDAGHVYAYDLASPIPRTPALTFDCPDPRVGDRFGASVAMSGKLLVASAPNRKVGAAGAVGIAYVYNLASATPTVPAFTLRNPLPVANAYFGSAVGISGSRVVVGAYGVDDGAGAFAGRAYVYDLAGATPELPMLTITNPAPAERDAFGISVAIEGTRIVIGATGDDAGAEDAGSAYVYDLAGANPAIPVATLNNPGPSLNESFGISVALSGNRVVVGAASDNSHTGGAYVYDLAGAVPTVPILTLTSPTPVEKEIFGSAVAIAGTIVLVADPGDNTTSPGAGSAYLYDLTSGTPAEPAANLQNYGAGEAFGGSVATDGNLFVIGAPREDRPSIDSGSVYVYGPGVHDADHDGLLDIWEHAHFGTTIGHSALDDADGDGLSELIEQAFNRDPLVPDAAGAPGVVNEGGYLTITIAKRGGVNYTVESAGSPNAPAFSAATTTVLIDNATTLKVRDNFPIGAAPARFMRVKVSSIVQAP